MKATLAHRRMALAYVEVLTCRIADDRVVTDADRKVGPRDPRAIAHQATGLDIFAPWVGSGNLVTSCQRHDLIAPGREECVGADQNRASLLPGGRGKGGREVAFSSGFQDKQVQ